MANLTMGDIDAYEMKQAGIISWLLSKEVGCVVFVLAAPDLQSIIDEPDGAIPGEYPAATILKVRACLCETFYMP